MANRITPQPGILDIAVYQGGQAHLDGVAEVLKLSSNENPFGPGDKARVAFERASTQLHRYPSTDHADLRGAIAKVHDLDMDRIICGVGSDEILAFLCQAYAGPGDEVLYTEHGFGMYKIYGRSVGATTIEVGETDRVLDVDKILAGCTERTRLIFIANPSNPTGTMIDLNQIERLADGIPDQAILVLDGAYAEFAQEYDGGAKLVETHDNVVMTRTFSKLYGLGGLRVGWGYGPREIIDVLNRIRGPFNLSSPALATALAAVRDVEHVEKCRVDNARMRAWLAQSLAAHGVLSDTSHTNFILARFGSQNEAESCDDYLKTQGIIVRRVAGYQLPECLRITVGDEAGCRRVAHAIGQFKAGLTKVEMT